MFPNNPLFVDKLLQSRQEDIERGIPDPHAYDLPHTGRSPVKFKKARIWVPVGAILVLAWWFLALI